MFLLFVRSGGYLHCRKIQRTPFLLPEKVEVCSFSWNQLVWPFSTSCQNSNKNMVRFAKNVKNLYRHTKIATNLLFWPRDALISKKTLYSRGPTDSDTLIRGMGGLERNPGTTRWPQRSTGLPVRLGDAGTAVWLGLTWAPAQNGTRATPTRGSSPSSTPSISGAVRPVTMETRCCL